MHIATKELPEKIQNMLKSMGYAKKDISVEGAESISPVDMPYKGNRCYFAVINLATGEQNVSQGSWGGANAFNPENRVDLDSKNYPIPENVVVIKGQSGYLNTASIYVNPINLQKFIPEKIEITEEERNVLEMFRGLTPAGRKNEISRKALYDRNYPAKFAAIADALVAKGLLKRNKAGATQITTEGKNAIAR